MAGLYTNERVAVQGRKMVLHLLAGTSEAETTSDVPLTVGAWNRLTIEEQSRRLVSALRKIETDGPPMSGPVALGRLAQTYSESLLGDLTKSSVETTPPVVLWLVGRTIQPAALEQVRLWRRVGLDARALMLEGRMHSRGWTLRHRGENAPARDALEARLMSTAAGEEGTVRLDLYEPASASARVSHGGGLLDRPKATMEQADGTQTVLEG